MDKNMRLVSLAANKDGFHSVYFKEGMNVVLATRIEKSTEQDSRNGVGKTSFLQLIDFCLGASKLPDNLQKGLKGDGWEFTLTLRFGDDIVAVTRAVDTGDLTLESGPDRLYEQTTKDGRLPHTRWRTWLGKQMYGLTSAIAAAPSFRQCILYNLRTSAGAYVSPFQTHTNQKAFQKQQTNAFLLGLDMNSVEQWDSLLKRKQMLEALSPGTKKEAATLQSMLLGDRQQLVQKRQALQEDIDAFEVFPQYREVETQINLLTQQAQELVNQMTIGRRMLKLYREQQAEPDESVPEDLWAIFEEAGAKLGKGFIRQVDQVLAFHQEVASNRRTYLESEIARLTAEQTLLSERIQEVDQERSRQLNLLRSKGALDEFVELERRLAHLDGEIESLTARIDAAKATATGKADLKVKIAEVVQETERDFSERADTLAPLLAKFTNIVEELYGKKGHLGIAVGESGYRFSTDMPRDGSHGVGKMEIFAYDLSLNYRLASLIQSPGFLAHDSLLFDGVDERQRAKAIKVAADFSQQTGVQYLMVQNTDMIPEDDLEAIGFNIEGFQKSVILELGDDDPSNALFGFRWEK